MDIKLNQHIAFCFSTRTFLCCFAVSCLLTGCGGSGTSAEMLPTASNLSRLAMLYSRCQYDSRGTPPATEQEFRQYVDGLPEFDGELDELMKSKRDGESYVILYGRDIIETGLGSVIGYESKGVNGKFFVGYDDGRVEAMDQASMDKLKKMSTRAACTSVVVFRRFR